MNKFEFKTNERGNLTVKYVGAHDPEKLGHIADEHIIVPSEFNGQIVDEIAENGFDICEETYSIYIPKSIIKIGKNAFNNDINAILYFEGYIDYDAKYHSNFCTLHAYLKVSAERIYRDEMFDYILNNDLTAKITHYNGGDSEIVVPDSVTVCGKTYRIVKVSAGTFENPCVWDANKIIIPKSIEEVCDDFNRVEKAEIVRI